MSPAIFFPLFGYKKMRPDGKWMAQASLSAPNHFSLLLSGQL